MEQDGQGPAALLSETANKVTGQEGEQEEGERRQKKLGNVIIWKDKEGRTKGHPQGSQTGSQEDGFGQDWS